MRPYREIKEILADDWGYYGNEKEMLDPKGEFSKGPKIDLDAALNFVDQKFKRKKPDSDKDGFVRNDIEF